MSKLDRHMRSDGVKWFFVVVAFLLIGVILCGMLTDWFTNWNKFGLFDRFIETPETEEPGEESAEKSQTLRFEAEDGELSGGCKAVDDSQNEDGRIYVGDFTNSATVTFELDASAETPVTMLVRITSPREDTPLKELMTINVNGEPFESDVTAKGAGEAKWTTWQTLLAGRLVLKKGANAIVFGGALDGVNFDFFKILFPASVTVTVHQENGGLAVDKSVQGSGIFLVSTHIPVALYEEYGISPAAENAQTITATVSPDNDATNTGVTWSAAWEDPSSEWATGKEVQEYLTLTPAGEGYKESKTVTVQCLQAFGEKIVITCKSVDNPAVQATVNAHYVQKLEDFTLKFGDFDIVPDGDTNCIFEINTEVEGQGGLVSYEIRQSDTYTDAVVVRDDGVSVCLVGISENDGVVIPWAGSSGNYDFEYSDDLGTYLSPCEISIIGKTVRFDFSYMTLINAEFVQGSMPSMHSVYYKDDPLYFGKRSSNWDASDIGKPFAKVKCQFTYNDSEIVYNGNLIYNGYIASVSDVSTDHSDLYY